MMRCCGSIDSASRGATLKKAASKQSTSDINPARMQTDLFGAARSGLWNNSARQRPEGTLTMLHTPPARFCQNASASGAPGMRQARPTTAT